MSLNQNILAKATKDQILNTLCEKIELKRRYNYRRVPHGLISKFVESHHAVHPWLIRDHVNNTLRKRDRERGIVAISGSDTDLTATGVTDTALAVSTADTTLTTGMVARARGGDLFEVQIS